MKAAERAIAPFPTLPPPRLWAPGRKRLLTGLVLTVTLVGFESLAISTVMPVVARDLGGLALYGWVFSGFFLGNLIGIVFAGQAADRRGTAAPFAAGLVLLAVGLVVGGLAPSMPVLVLGRVAQGIGAGAIPPVAYTAVGRSIPAELRPRVFAVFSSAWVIPGLMGPAAAAAITAAVGWRGVFLGLLPLVVVAAAMTVPALDRGRESHGHHEADRRPLSLALVAGAAALLAALGGAMPPIAAATLGAAGAVVAAASFLRLVPSGTVRFAAGMPAAVMARGVLTFAFFGADAYVSLALADVRGEPIWVAGVALTAATLLWTTGAWIQERLVHRLGPRRLVMTGFAGVALGIGGLVAALVGAPLWPSVAVWSLAGLGMGLAYPSISLTVLGTAPAGQEGNASASLQLTDVLGVALGTGLAGAFVALGEGRGWRAEAGLEAAFAVTVAVALAGVVAARRLPGRLGA